MAELENGGSSPIAWTVTDDRLFVRLRGDFDLATSELLERELTALLETPATSVEIEMSGVGFLDSSGVVTLLRITNRFGPSAVFGASPMVQQVINLLGLNEELLVRPDDDRH
jgi:anti-anti-sigma factor